MSLGVAEIEAKIWALSFEDKTELLRVLIAELDGPADADVESALLKRLNMLSRECPGLTHTFNFIVGAVYSLRKARRFGHRDRVTYGDTDPSGHVSRLSDAIDAVAVGAIPEPVWIAGFYYNAAIMRIDACYERLLRAMLAAAGVKPEKVTEDQPWTDTMAGQLERTLNLDPPLAREHLTWARKEVNNLKHKLFGQEPSHALKRPEPSDLTNAIAAIDELLAAMERQEIRLQLASHFAATPPQ